MFKRTSCPCELCRVGPMSGGHKKIGTQPNQAVSLSRRCTKSGCCRFPHQGRNQPPVAEGGVVSTGVAGATGAFFATGFLAGFLAGFFAAVLAAFFTAFLTAFLTGFLTGFLAAFLAGFFAAFFAAFLAAFFTTFLATFKTSLLKDTLGAVVENTCHVTHPQRAPDHNTNYHVPVSAAKRIIPSKNLTSTSVFACLAIVVFSTATA